jgi:hypothetical protein
VPLKVHSRCRTPGRPRADLLDPQLDAVQPPGAAPGAVASRAVNPGRGRPSRRSAAPAGVGGAGCRGGHRPVGGVVSVMPAWRCPGREHQPSTVAPMMPASRRAVPSARWWRSWIRGQDEVVAAVAVGQLDDQSVAGGDGDVVGPKRILRGDRDGGGVSGGGDVGRGRCRAPVGSVACWRRPDETASSTRPRPAAMPPSGRTGAASGIGSGRVRARSAPGGDDEADGGDEELQQGGQDQQ